MTVLLIRRMDQTPFDDSSISVVGKVFLAGVAASILGVPSNIRVRGTPDEVAALKAALAASRELRDELHRPGATVQSVMDRLHVKNTAAQAFEDCLGLPWPL